MKKHANILLLLASLAIILLLGLAVFITLYIKDNSPPAESAPSDTAALAPSAAAQMEVRTGTFEGYKPEAPHDFVFVGDSRTLAMAKAVNEQDPADTCIYIAREGEGLYWLRSDGITLLQEVLEQTPAATVILNLGVNDLKEQDEYIAYYEKLFSDYPAASFYIMSVNPIEEDKFANITNADIEAFNLAMQEAFPNRYLDCYHYLLSGTFTTIDGLHYPEDVSRAIHHYTVASLVN